MLLTIEGNWEGSFYISEDFAFMIKDTTYYYKITFQQQNDKITGTCIDADTGVATTIEGKLKKNSINFVKTYRGGTSVEDDGCTKQYFEDEPIPVYYRGIVEGDTMSGEWTFPMEVPFLYFFKKRHTMRGTWKMWRI
ncbi:hypothetical protein LX64_04248 [Chitinophaga skermanii]|uniref:Lipocalin-like protein n=1 Tax=Chitinophaga skermanii TaxID=331697 RepID=A0A327Q760_9BACT|nr:hypothetical protein [Chitinophaga skermanii]RAI99703.1 hypothetical protein LX64_04248 [Chitinophaga skermanii]